MGEGARITPTAYFAIIELASGVLKINLIRVS
jgi:hypothetical protein